MTDIGTRIERITRNTQPNAANYGFGDLADRGPTDSMPWLHVPTRGTLRIAVVSTRAFRYRAHWLRGRMRPCTGESCQACADNIGAQTKFIIAAQDQSSLTTGLIELAAPPASIIAQAVQAAGYLRGLTFDLRKDGGRYNGKILIEPAGCLPTFAGLPAEPDIPTIMRDIWAAT